MVAKEYIDLMFSSTDNTFVEWIENLEESLQKKYMKNRENGLKMN